MTATLPLFDDPVVMLDPDVQRVLDSLWSNPVNADERALIVRGIYEVARAHHGVVDTNALRAWLHSPERECWLTKPQLVGSVINRLCRKGLLMRAGRVVSTDRRGGNAGREVPLYRLVGDPR